MKKIQHIAIVCPSFPEKEDQGIIIPPLQVYVKELRRLYPEVTISILPVHIPNHSTSYSWNGCRVYPIGANNGSFLTRLFSWYKLLDQLKTIHRTTPIDLLHSFWFLECTLLAQRFSKKFAIPHIATLMGQDAKRSNYQYLINADSAIPVVLTSFHRTIFEKNYAVKAAAIIPFGISSSDPDFPILPHPSRTIDVVTVSSFISLKRIDLAIEVYARLLKFNPSLKIHVIGNGPEYASLMKLIRDKGLEGKIILRGELTRKECLAEMAQSKILLHTSEYEGQGYVQNEALAVGCKVVSLHSFLDITSNNYFCAQGNLELVIDKIKVWLSNEMTHDKEYPVTMENTVEMYGRLFQQYGRAL